MFFFFFFNGWGGGSAFNSFRLYTHTGEGYITEYQVGDCRWNLKHWSLQGYNWVGA